ncbi:pyroglutamyl peptidase I [Allocoleopsis franciscana PCC 7113]|uniref:Pyroglutamyl peptidase I n=1 Tax=Allocoleopsis franciscana PCC 7113 TaxID=1173027 RepID=K9WKV1_9CYAN|nr:pyroglutamyl peptidase I [Allocoleopsis franciscana PCC 7113]
MLPSSVSCRLNGLSKTHNFSSVMSHILLTSFQTWLPHQQSNSSDDLLEEVAKLESFPHSLTFLRHLPVDIAQASQRAIAKINELQPDIIICCGMAESRRQLSVESNASLGDTVLKTPVDLERLLDSSIDTTISHNAGKFVCEGLYYSVLNYLQKNELKKHGLFVHVPILTRNNMAEVLTDVELIMHRLTAL